jgi:hypothetical protein
MTKLSKKKYIGLGYVPIGIGAIIKGWDITEEQVTSKGRIFLLIP